MTTCRDCIAEGLDNNRPAPHAGPRCATHHRAVRKSRTTNSHDKYVCETYGLLPGEYATLYEIQGRCCAICRRATGATRRLAVDHDHAVEAEQGMRQSVRGLLCKPCNRMLGHGRDDPEFFQRAARYLTSPPAHEVIE
jgi:hypothetical protein